MLLLPRSSGEKVGCSRVRLLFLIVIPAQAGIQRRYVGAKPRGGRYWIPACAGMTGT
jgi:hypothetical protein